MHPYMHAHPCSLEKLLVDQSFCTGKILILYYSLFLCSMLLFCSALRLYNILVVNGVANYGRPRNSLNDGEYNYNKVR